MPEFGRVRRIGSLVCLFTLCATIAFVAPKASATQSHPPCLGHRDRICQQEQACIGTNPIVCTTNYYYWE